MDERIANFIQGIEKQLQGLPEPEIRKAVGFYEEYLGEAVDAGKDPEELLQTLGSPEKIAAMLRAETSMIKAESNPSLQNFSKVLRNAFRYVTTPFTVFLLSLVVLVCGGMVVGFFGGVIAAITGAIAVAIVLIYEGIRIPSHFLLEIIGTIGMALFGSGICLLVAFYLYKAARILIQFSIKLIRLIVKISGRSRPESTPLKNTPKAKSQALAYTLLGLTIVGGILMGVSGLPWRYFIIFNSMRSEATVKKMASQYEPGGIEKLSIVTAHSKIKISRNLGDKIIITYEQPDWLNYELGSDGSMLSFYEKSNGRLPLFRLVAFHESFTELVVSLPKRYNPELIHLESTGGPIRISGLAENLTAITLNGGISFESAGIAGNYSLKANTKNGNILVNGTGAGQKVSEGIEYYRKARITNKPGQATIELSSSNGDINIEIN